MKLSIFSPNLLFFYHYFSLLALKRIYATQVLEDVTSYSKNLTNRELEVIGKEDRVRVANTNRMPYKLVGKLRLNDSAFCTACIIGKHIVVTAASCVLESGKFKNGALDAVFLIGCHNDKYNHERCIDKSTVKYIYVADKYPKDNPSLDVAIVTLNKPLGLSYGHFGVRGYRKSTSISNLRMYQYSNTYLNGSMTEQFCSINDMRGGLFVHNCDTSGYASTGSALIEHLDSNLDGIEEEYVVGIHIHSNKKGPVNMAVMGGHIYDLLKRIKDIPKPIIPTHQPSPEPIHNTLPPPTVTTSAPLSKNNTTIPERSIMSNSVRTEQMFNIVFLLFQFYIHYVAFNE